MIRVSCRLAFGAFVALAATACANATQAGDRSAPTAAPHDRTVLYGDELHAGSDHYLYDVIQRLRPEWLRVHGSTSIATGLSGNTDPDVIHVYVGVVRVGGPAADRQRGHAPVLHARAGTSAIRRRQSEWRDPGSLGGSAPAAGMIRRLLSRWCGSAA